MHTRKFLGISLLLMLFIASCGKSAKKNETASTANSTAKSNAEQQQKQSADYITAADVEKVSGFKGVIFVPRNPRIGAGGDLNFATSDSNLIVMVQIVGESFYAGYKQYYFKSAVQGLGDEAMQGATIKGLPVNLVAFRKGPKCVALTVFVNKNNFSKNMLSPEQIVSLAKVIESRI